MNAQQLRQRWAGFAPRERALILAAAALVAIALVWWIALAPALATLRSADAQHRALDAQLLHMKRLQSQARMMQSQPRQGLVAALALAQWLTQVRTNARAIPGEARLARNPAGGWDGSLVLTLPAR